jgi:hypothetical protein
MSEIIVTDSATGTSVTIVDASNTYLVEISASWMSSTAVSSPVLSP